MNITESFHLGHVKMFQSIFLASNTFNLRALIIRKKISFRLLHFFSTLQLIPLVMIPLLEAIDNLVRKTICVIVLCVMYYGI